MAHPQEKAVQQPIKAEEKPGRNDPCPCGSGKKFKQCCRIKRPNWVSASILAPNKEFEAI
ncbi:SEC-C metal-binding domain-containing protein [Escherichia coli]